MKNALVWWGIIIFACALWAWAVFKLRPVDDIVINTNELQKIEVKAELVRPAVDVLLMDIAALSHLASICDYQELNARLMNSLVYLAETESQNSSKSLLIIARVITAMKTATNESGGKIDEELKAALCNEDNREKMSNILRENEGHLRWYSDYVL